MGESTEWIQRRIAGLEKEKCNPKHFHIVSLSSGVFEIAEASGVQQGTKIVLHLKDDCKEFSSEDRVKGTTAAAALVNVQQLQRSNTLTQHYICFLFQRL